MKDFYIPPMSDKRIAEIESAVENYIKHERDMMYGYDDELTSQVRYLSQLVTEVKYQRKYNGIFRTDINMVRIALERSGMYEDKEARDTANMLLTRMFEELGRLEYDAQHPPIEEDELQQGLCPNCGELIVHTADRLDCPYCGYGCDYPYEDRD